ncbi:MAG: SDR family oxidoreductase [gamma proteobacterium symbiont of Taylorina sp.]|nr:SDR family oxidoreductase [gamma proteobacterium symbiont of Taylorina sp.]
MNILIVGVSGFIGQHLYHALSQDGHSVIGCSRHEISNINWIKFNFKQNQNEWEQQLQAIDLVINTAGIYQQSNQLMSNQEGFSQVHDLGPKRLFDACRNCHIKVIQISAIGAEQNKPVTEFLQSKRNADQYLLTHPLPNVVLYPGIVLGEKGKTTRQLSLLASLYCIPLVFGRQKKLPLISIYQLTEVIKEFINNWPETSVAKVLIAKPETMKNLLINLRRWMNLGKGFFIVIPEQLTRLAFYFFPKLSFGAFNKQSVAMLADYSNKTTPMEISAQESASDSLLKYRATKGFKQNIQIKILFFLNLLVLGVIWIVSGLSSIISIEQSRELISLIGINGNLGDAIIITAAVGDIFLGLLLWLGLWYQRLMKWIIYTQIGVMITYSIILSIALPIFWLHPFAPIIKNLAVLILSMYLLIEKNPK